MVVPVPLTNMTVSYLDRSFRRKTKKPAYGTELNQRSAVDFDICLPVLSLAVSVQEHIRYVSAL
jgi:hypothetical protein